MKEEYKSKYTQHLNPELDKEVDEFIDATANKLIELSRKTYFELNKIHEFKPLCDKPEYCRLQMMITGFSDTIKIAAAMKLEGEIPDSFLKFQKCQASMIAKDIKDCSLANKN